MTRFDCTCRRGLLAEKRPRVIGECPELTVGTVSESGDEFLRDVWRIGLE